MKLKVDGMKCEHCVATVRKALAAVHGVTAVTEVSRERSEAIVEGDARPEELLAAVRDSGYRAEIIP